MALKPWRALLPLARKPGLGGSRGVYSEAESEVLKFHTFYDNEVERASQEPLQSLSVQRMLEFGQGARGDATKVLTSARFVHTEIPKRLARRLMDLQFLPYVVVTNPHIKQVYSAYFNAFHHLRKMRPIETMEDNGEFTAVLKRMVDEHAPMLHALERGLRECKTKPVVGEHIQLDSFLDNMLHSRISRRVIAEQHICLDLKREGYIGIVCTELEIKGALDFAVERTKQVCYQTYGRSPEVVLEGDVRAVAPYVTAHLDYMLFELLKNACRAAVENHMRRGLGGKVPKVRVTVCEAADEVTIRFSDQGGGIPEWLMGDVWKYGYTTARSSPPGQEDTAGEGAGAGAGAGAGGWEGGGLGGGGFAGQLGGLGGGLGGDQGSPMAGLGFGLPLSRLRYFGGDLQLVSMPGYGVDAYLRISKLGTHTATDI